MRPAIPQKLVQNLGHRADGAAWLQGLADAIAELAKRWSLTLDKPIEAEASCSWAAPCTRTDGTQAIFKLGFPHMEAAHEIDGLAFWSGDPTVLLLEADREANAMLLERCVPGTTLRSLPDADQDVVIAGLLRQLWRTPQAPHPFRPLDEMIGYWSDESRAKAELWPDRVLAEEGLSVYADLLADETEQTLLATDLHAGNVLRAARRPWLVIDPKPFVGDPCYDATQHLLNRRERLQADPNKTIAAFANLLGLDAKRIRLWTFARLAAEWHDDTATSQRIARRLVI